MNEVFNVVGIITVAFTAGLANTILGMMDEKTNESIANDIMEEYEEYTEGV